MRDVGGSLRLHLAGGALEEGAEGEEAGGAEGEVLDLPGPRRRAHALWWVAHRRN